MADEIEKGQALITSIRQFMGPDTVTERKVKQALADGTAPEQLAEELQKMLREASSNG